MGNNDIVAAITVIIVILGICAGNVSVVIDGVTTLFCTLGLIFSAVAIEVLEDNSKHYKYPLSPETVSGALGSCFLLALLFLASGKIMVVTFLRLSIVAHLTTGIVALGMRCVYDMTNERLTLSSRKGSLFVMTLAIFGWAYTVGSVIKAML
ncbi:MAG TPA: hypothetical protein P5056_02990 [Candidatus Paceibacterota bacterium]|nr:hypothetical protein [Candidatus Paceibacterota bacterium]